MPRLPAEWTPHAACWLAFPHLEEEWGDAFSDAQEEHAALVRAISVEGAEPVRLLVPGKRVERRAASLIGATANVSFETMTYGDSWTRDTAPIFALDDDGRGVVAKCFRFDGWGRKYRMPGDADLSPRIAERSGARREHLSLVLEGGSLDVDGEGTCLTTESCLLDGIRNPSLGRAELERALGDALGLRAFVWLERGLENDHTDGHIDTLARFVAPGVVVCMEPAGALDPNREVLRTIEATLRESKDGRGRRLDVRTIRSPGEVCARDGTLLAASYCNFYVANEAVLVPTYGVANDAAAVDALRALFPTRRVTGLSARAIVHGGGAFHCVTQQQPRPS